MDKEEFSKIEKLYHYTNMSSLAKILENKSLLYGKLPRMNDINERQKEVYIDQMNGTVFPSQVFSDISRELKHLGQISLTKDSQQRRGFDIPAMWGNYARSGNGACIVLDRNKIIERCKIIGCIYGEVEYKDSVNPIIYKLGDGESIHDYLKRQSQDLFFTKTSDWSYEQEFRILRIDEGSPSMIIDECIIAIIMYHNTEKSIFDTSRFKIIKQIAVDIPVLVYSNTALWGLSLIDDNANDWGESGLSGLRN